MGLDMYAYVANKKGQYNDFYETAEFDATTSEFVSKTVTKPYEIAYWRKHPNLHGWMEQLWEQRNEDLVVNNSDMQFNTVYLELTLDDLTDLEYQNEGETLPETTGFFFGKSDETDKEKNKEFIEIARQAINDDYRVYYWSWW